MNTATKPRDVLLLEANHNHREYLRNYLSNQGYAISISTNPDEMIRMAGRTRFGLALVDAGYFSARQTESQEWERTFCQRNDLGVILLSSEGSSRESVRALNLGADDYVSKPFHDGELLARIRAVMRRYPAANNSNSDAQWCLHPAGRYLLSPEDLRICLTGRELGLLSLLTATPGEPVSRDQISQSLMGREWLPGDRSMDVLVRRLRAKLHHAGGRELIKTERHIGYLVDNVQVSH